MNLTAPNKIKKLELSHHESHNRNKKLAGYHVFLTRFIVDLRCLSYTEKEKIVSDEKLRGTTAALLVTSPIRSRSPPNPSLPLSGSFEPEDSDTDSDTDLFLGDPLFAGPCTSSDPLFAGPVGGRGPLRIPMAKFVDKDFDVKEAEVAATDASFKWRPGEYFKLAGIYWRRLPEKGREAWRVRARFINNLVPVGVFVKVPKEVNKSFVTLALASLTADCDVLRRSFALVLRRRRPPREVSQSSVSFLSERVNIQSQYLLRASMSLLLQNIIFGVDFKKLTPREVVKRTKKTIVIHIRSARRLQQLFAIRDTCMVTSEFNQALYWACPKVFFKNTFGYVLDDDPAGRRLLVHQVDNDQRFSLTSYELWPIRIMIRNTHMSMIFSRAVFAVNKKGKKTVLRTLSS